MRTVKSENERATIAMLGVAATLGVTVAVIAQCPPQYQVAAVIDPPTCGIFGPTTPSVWTINEQGQAAGSYQCLDGPSIPFVWTQAKGLTVLPLPSGVIGAGVADINNILGTDGMGQMTGTMDPVDTPYRGYFLDDGEWIDLGLLPGSTMSHGNGVNDSGVIAGRSWNNISGPRIAFKWENGEMTPLSGLTGPNSSASAINEAGQITGWMGDGQITDALAFIWHNGNVTALPPVPGGTTSQGRAINEHGDVAGQGKYFDPEWDANVWRGYAYIDGEAIRIDPLPGFKNLTTYRISSSGQIVGYMWTILSRAILWQDGTTYDLNDLVPAGSPTLTSARTIDEQGRIVVRTGAPDWGAVLLSPLPQPPGDLDCDGAVGVDDLLILLSAWGECDDPDDCPADLDGDGAVGVDDLLILLANWG